MPPRPEDSRPDRGRGRPVVRALSPMAGSTLGRRPKARRAASRRAEARWRLHSAEPLLLGGSLALLIGLVNVRSTAWVAFGAFPVGSAMLLSGLVALVGGLATALFADPARTPSGGMSLGTVDESKRGVWLVPSELERLRVVAARLQHFVEASNGTAGEDSVDPGKGGVSRSSSALSDPQREGPASLGEPRPQRAGEVAFSGSQTQFEDGFDRLMEHLVTLPTAHGSDPPLV